MMENSQVRKTKKLINQAIFLHEMRKYDIDDVCAVSVVDESVEKYCSEKNKLMNNKYVAGVKTKLDLSTISKILVEIRTTSNVDLYKIANTIYATFKSFNSNKSNLIKIANQNNDLEGVNKVAKKNNAYVYLCETIGRVVVERIRDKKDVSILKGFSNGMLKFVLKEAITRKVKNEINYGLGLESGYHDEFVIRENGYWQQIIDEVQKVYQSRKYDMGGVSLQSYEQQLKAEQQEWLDYINE